MIKNAIATLLILGAVGVFFMWTRPFLEEIGQLSYEKKIVNETLESSRELINLRDDIVSNFNIISSEDLNRFSKILPSESDKNKLMVQLSNTANLTGVIIEKLEMREQERKGLGGTPLGDDPYNILELEIDLLGTYEGFFSFLEETEKSLRLVDIDHINFSSSEEGLFEFTIKGETYFKK